MQQHYLLNFELFVQEIETLVAFCVQQHYLLKFDLYHQKIETLVAFCVQQHHLLKFEGCAVVSVFGSDDYDWKKKVPVICLAGCAVVSVFGSGEK